MMDFFLISAITDTFRTNIWHLIKFTILLYIDINRYWLGLNVYCLQVKMLCWISYYLWDNYTSRANEQTLNKIQILLDLVIYWCWLSHRACCLTRDTNINFFFQIFHNSYTARTDARNSKKLHFLLDSCWLHYRLLTVQ